MIELEIDGKDVTVADGSTIMDAAREAGIYIPHFCYHKKLSIAANCRMCLVQVEKAAKPLPACATPVTEGMRVFTHSESAVRAQKGVMEFLLINHPLDCPICDQGGECQLQDLAVGYGASSSRYGEAKRVVLNKDLGPLVATDMTRCIHCTRCVRFGQEIAGIQELGMIGRGEHAEITPFVARTVDSELSGNIIDLCPVGALTSKPFRYTARNWELSSRPSVSPHDALGSNLRLQVKQNRVMRVLPLENEAINECWLSDKDRFSYEALNSEERLTRPMISRDGHLRECEWQEALEHVAAALARIRADHGPDAIGALAVPYATLEELYLLQKLMRGLGSGNVDHRLRQADFSLDLARSGAPWLGQSVASLSALDAVLVIGSTLRKDHPLIAQRLRQAVKRGAELHVVNPTDDDLLVPIANRFIVRPSALADTILEIVHAACEHQGVEVPARWKRAAIEVREAARATARSLIEGQATSVLLGNLAQHHPAYGRLALLAQDLARVTGSTFGVLGEAANSVGAYVAGAVPNPIGADALHGRNAGEMLATPRRAYVLLGVEPELDCRDPAGALAAMHEAEFVVAFTAFKTRAPEYADVILPIAPFSETAGSFISTEGRLQSFQAAVTPQGEARPAWKVLRVLGNLLSLAGFDYETVNDVRMAMGTLVPAMLENRVACEDDVPDMPATELERIGEIPPYYADAIVRRARALQATKGATEPVAWMTSRLMARLGVASDDRVRIRQGQGAAEVRVRADDRLPDGCVRLAAGHPATAGLDAMFGEVTVEALGVRPGISPVSA
ncbi:MAG: NADH-quinone oxidoreductase subunit NuoG [Betaproteobacteria bacterium]|nr:NADH-quinone oxidoreductase subunit NuoG [Betaproteobacteria bacterium]